MLVVQHADFTQQHALQILLYFWYLMTVKKEFNKINDGDTFKTKAFKQQGISQVNFVGICLLIKIKRSK